MIRDVHISGRVSERHEYYATIIGPNLNIRLLYDGRNEPGKVYDRFFHGGSEIRISPEGVGHTGTGGAFCSYMFGVDIPGKDLLRRHVRNRLVMHGARYDEDSDRLMFSRDTASFETFSRIFNEGHAYSNYYFFVAGDWQANVRQTQETVLRVVGKFLKRLDLGVGGRDGRDLARSFYEACGAPNWTLFVVKLIDVNAETYYERYRSAYGATREIGDDEQRTFDLLARHYRLDPFQQERIHLDVIYEQEDNKRIIDAYKEALTAHLEQALPEHTLMPKLNLLRAFSTRNRIPGTLFDRLDSLLVNADGHDLQGEPAFVTEARSVLQKLFVEHVGGDVELDDLIRLLHAKRQALQQRYVGFEAVLLDAARASDEWAEQGKSLKLRAQFEQIINYLDLFDSASLLVNSIAFFDDYEITPYRLEELLETQHAFDELRPNLFEELMVTPLEDNKYLNLYGRRRIEALRDGLREADREPASSRKLTERIRRVNEVARLHRIVDGMLRMVVGDIHVEPLDAELKELLRRDVESRLRAEYGIATRVDPELLDAVLAGIREEYFYAKELLPTIIATRDLKLRDEFLRSSGLDLFRVEELEAAYVRR